MSASENDLDGATYSHTNNGVTDNINWKQKVNLLNNVTEGYNYDNLYQLLSFTLSAGSGAESYTYDAVGNRLSVNNGGPWVYNSSNELQARPGVSYTFDSNGNMLTKVNGSSTTNFGWDFENRLNAVTLRMRTENQTHLACSRL